jgi:hypothetical protein
MKATVANGCSRYEPLIAAELTDNGLYLIASRDRPIAELIANEPEG